jgi:non-heme chloroperoxidase
MRGNPGGLPIEVFDGFCTAYLADRAPFFLDVASGPFFGFNRPGAKVSQGLIQSWWMQGMMSRRVQVQREGEHEYRDGHE